jgi:hypothetical protein
MIAATPTHFVLCAIYLYVFNSMHWVVGTHVHCQIKVEKAVKNMYKTCTDIHDYSHSQIINKRILVQFYIHNHIKSNYPWLRKNLLLMKSTTLIHIYP